MNPGIFKDTYLEMIAPLQDILYVSSFKYLKPLPKKNYLLKIMMFFLGITNKVGKTASVTI